MNRLNKISAIFIFLAELATFSGMAFPSSAALPDRETFEFVTRKYNMFLEAKRSGCSYYGNPKTLSRRGNERFISVLHVRGESGGSACNGVFEFKVLKVKCQSQEVSYSDEIGSPANYVDEWEKNSKVAEMICAIAPR